MAQIRKIPLVRERGSMRVHPRTRTFLAAHVLPDEGIPILCVVRDMSRFGACLVLRTGEHVPERFRLHLLTRGRIYAARRVWQRGELAGVELTGEALDWPT